jgi:hypothetical protein
VTRLKRTLAFWVFSYVEPGTAAAAALGVRQPFCSHGGAGMPLFPCLSHRVTTRCGRTLFGDFRLFGVHILLKTMDIPRRKIAPVCLESGRSLPAIVTYSGAEPRLLPGFSLSWGLRRPVALVAGRGTAFTEGSRSARSSMQTAKCSGLTLIRSGSPLLSHHPAKRHTPL